MKATLGKITFACLCTVLLVILPTCDTLDKNSLSPFLADTIPTIHQGVYGRIYFWEGDFMPMIYPDSARGRITPVQRTVVVHTPTRFDSVDQADYSPFYREILTPRAGTTSSNSAGFFQIELAPGRYSFFVVEESMYYANGGDGYGYLCPATVVKDSLTYTVLNITYKASF